MKLRVVPSLIVWVSCAATSSACGPFFPDTVLDRPQSSLEVPAFSYLAGLYQIVGKELPKDEEQEGDGTVLGQIPLEVSELESTWRAEGIEADFIALRVKHYEEVRTKLLTGLTDIGLQDFPTQQGAAVELPERPLGADFPKDVADYVEGARLQAIGKKEEARTQWKGILARPANERRLRSVWAAWMLAKTSPDLPECLGWYERVEQEAAGGAADVLGLRNDAKVWRAPRMDDPVAGMHLLLEAFQNGRHATARDLEILSWRILRDQDTSLLNKAAADPVVRRLINLELHVSTSGSSEVPQQGDESVTAEDDLTRWLGALESQATLPLEDGARIAWAVYASGRFEEARHWLDLSVKDDPLALWLQAKFDLRAGKLEDANQHLSAAVRTLSSKGDWHPDNLAEEYGAWQRLSSTQGRLLADAGIVALAREDYSQALESLRRGGYDVDAAYVAERVLSTDELLAHVRQHAPKWEEESIQAPMADGEEPSVTIEADPATCLPNDGTWMESFTPGNRLRWQLARRLAREGRFQEAGEFMPPTLKKLWDHQVALEMERRSGRWTGEALAAILWREARLHRHWGAELFSTDSAPDGGIHGWSFEATDLTTMRIFKDGWSQDWEQDPSLSSSEFPSDRAVPIIASDELERVGSHPLPNASRFHYRYVAVDLAMEAARNLPDNHPQLAPLLNTAGLWLAARDPEAADRLYQTLVKRCKETAMGQAADKKRWFIQDGEPLEELAAMPPTLMPAAIPKP